MEEGRILKFTLTKSEVNELALRLTTDCILMTKTIWLGLALLVFLPSIVFSIAGIPQPGAIHILVSNLSICGACVLFYAVTRYLGFCRFCKKNGFLEERVYRLEHGSLTYMGDGSSLHGSHFTLSAETRRLLLLKRPLSKGSFQFYVFPKRIFDSPDDILAFLSYFQNPQSFYEEAFPGSVPQDDSDAVTQAATGTTSATAAPTASPTVSATASPTDFSTVSPAASADGLYRFSFSLTEDDFAHVYTQVVRIVRNHSSLLSLRTLLLLVIPLAFLTSTVIDMMINGDFITGALFMSAGIMGLVYLLLKTTEIREDTYRKLIRSKRLPVNESGMWDMQFSDEGVHLKHDRDTFKRQWGTYTNLYETIDTYFLVRISGKRVEQYVFLPKWAFQDQDQQDGFLHLCGTKGLNKQYLHIQEAEDPQGTAARLRRRNIVLTVFTLLLFGLSIAAAILKPILMILIKNIL